MNAPEKMKAHDRNKVEYDRTAEDVGNIVHLEHFNCCIDDQRLAVLFYVVGLGGTRDPYIFTGFENIWLNFGRTQVHMPSRAVPPKAERLRCHAPAPEYGRTELGLVYVDFEVPVGTAEGIARFYNEVMKAPARVSD